MRPARLLDSQPSLFTDVDQSAPLLAGVDWSRSKIWTPLDIATRVGAPGLVGSSVGLAATFGGSADALITQVPNNASTNGVTMFALIKSNTASSTAAIAQPIVRTNSSGRGSLTFAWSHVSSTFAQAWASNDGGAWTPLKYTSTLAAGTWYLLSASVNLATGGFRIYVNGVQDGSATVGGFAGSTTSNLFIGSGSSDGSAAGSFFNGAIALAGELGKYWTPAEHAEFARNPWQLFIPQRPSPPFAYTGGGPTYTLTAASGTFALTGQDATLAFNRVLSAASGSFALTGQDATLAFNRVLSAASGAFTLTGQDVTLTYTPISGPTYTLTAAPGAFDLTGQDVTLAFNRVLSAASGAFVLTGQDATLTYTPAATYTLTANTGSFALTGQDVSWLYNRVLSADPGAFVLTGQDISLVYSGGAPAETITLTSNITTSFTGASAFVDSFTLHSSISSSDELESPI